MEVSKEKGLRTDQLAAGINLDAKVNKDAVKTKIKAENQHIKTASKVKDEAN